MDRLNEALNRHTAEIETSLRAARAELEELRERERELVDLIEQAEAALGHAPKERLTLHEAMTIVLSDGGNEWMTTRELADEINRRDLYRKRDGSPVESNQIHARAKNYEHLFDKDRQLVRLRDVDAPPPPPLPASRSKYDALRDHLGREDRDTVTETFEDIAELVGGLPPSAWRHQAWWANEASGSHVQARSWLNVGFRVARINQGEGWVRFQRDEGEDGLTGVREPRHPIPEGPADHIRADLPHGDSDPDVSS
jgi:hypothetical protein